MRDAIERCVICDWPLAKTQAEGCVPGDCSYRPADPDEQRKLAERHELVRRVKRDIEDAEDIAAAGAVLGLGAVDRCNVRWLRAFAGKRCETSANVVRDAMGVDYASALALLAQASDSEWVQR